MLRRYTRVMNLELSGREEEILRDILSHELGELRQQSYHAEAPKFKDQLKERETALKGLISKLH